MCQEEWKAPCRSDNPSLVCIPWHSRLQLPAGHLLTSKHKKSTGGGFLLESPDKILSLGFVLRFASRWKQSQRCQCCVFISFFSHPSFACLSWAVSALCSVSVCLALRRKITQQGEMLLLLYSRDAFLYIFCSSHRFPLDISRWPECRQCIVRRRSVLLYWNISCCHMQTPTPQAWWGKCLSSSRQASGG